MYVILAFFRIEMHIFWLANETYLPAGIYLFEVNNGNTRTMCEICSKLTIKTREGSHWNYTNCSGVFIVNFEQVNAGWIRYDEYANINQTNVAEIFWWKNNLSKKVYPSKERLFQQTFTSSRPTIETLEKKMWNMFKVNIKDNKKRHWRWHGFLLLTLNIILGVEQYPSHTQSTVIFISIYFPPPVEYLGYFILRIWNIIFKIS